jgi:hypothetical protein
VASGCAGEVPGQLVVDGIERRLDRCDARRIFQSR